LGEASLGYVHGGMSRDAAFQRALAPFAGEVVGMPDAFRAMIGLAPSLGMAWAESSFPLVVVSAKVAASYMATKMSKEVVKELVLPWRCFAIQFDGVTDSTEVMLVLDSSARGNGVQMHSMGVRGYEMQVEPSLCEYADLEFSGRRHLRPPSS
jgi:hypothetical protein